MRVSVVLISTDIDLRDTRSGRSRIYFSIPIDYI